MPDNNNGLNDFRVFKIDKDEDSTWRSQNKQSGSGESSKKQPKISKAKCKWLRKMTFEVNKYPYSNAKTIGLYSFDRSELEWYYKEIRLLADKVLDILECPFCEDTIKKAAMPGCGCSNPLVCCMKCWLEAGSICLNCNKKCSSLPFEPVDEIIRECHLFLKEKAFKTGMKVKDNDLKRICESYFQFLKQSEMQLMCDYCFGTLEKTITVDSGYGMRVQVCTGCHELYMECYASCTGFFPYPTFDKLNREFLQFFSKVLKYCKCNKTQLYKDPHPGFRQPSHFKQKVMQRHGFKKKAFGVFKKAVIVAACAYAVTYLVH